jgi:hypothetical protein
MQDWLTHPAIQAGIAPFVVALLLAKLLQPLRLSGLALIAGFALAVYLASDFSIEPLTAVRKIVWLGVAVAVLGLPLQWLKLPSWMSGVFALAAAGLALWVLQRILQQQEIQPMWQWGISSALYVGWMVYWLDGLQAQPVRAGSAATALGLGTGGAALLGGSALLGQLGLALGAAASAHLLVQILSRRVPCGRCYTLPLSLLVGLIAPLAVLTTELPSDAILPLGLIPLLARMPVSDKHARWLQSLLLLVLPLLCATLAIYLTWRVAGAPPL